MQDDQSVMETMIQNWVNFATFGYPSAHWTPVGHWKNQKYNFWNIFSNNPEMTYMKDIKERMELWDNIMNNNHQISRNGCISIQKVFFNTPFLFAFLMNMILFRS